MNLRKEHNKLHVVLVLDESGSMDVSRDATITGVNEQLQELRKKADILDTYITIITFSGHENIKVIRKTEPICGVKDLERKDYIPDGLTAMYDGVAKAINTIKQSVEDDESTTYLLIVVSDGQENSSKEYDACKIAEMIQELNKTKKWTISYMGANQDLSKISKDLGILPSNLGSYISSSTGTGVAWKALNSATASYCTTRGEQNARDYTGLSSNFLNPSISITKVPENINTTKTKSDTK